MEPFSFLVKQSPSFAFLFDPDKVINNSLEDIQRELNQSNVSFIFIGGSNEGHTKVEESVCFFKQHNPHIPIILFPGNETQISEQADAILLLSLLSGRNPEFLIEKQIRAARRLWRSDLTVIPTAYILLDGGRQSSVEKYSQTKPISLAREDFIIDTALAGQLMGAQAVYLEAGSGALTPIPGTLISAVKTVLNIPLIVGGGLTSSQQIRQASAAGADVVVVGNAIEKDLSLLRKLSWATSI